MKKILSSKDALNILQQCQSAAPIREIIFLPVQFLTDIPEKDLRKGRIIDAFVSFTDNDVLIYPTSDIQNFMRFTAEQVYVPHKVGDKITINNKRYFLAGTKNGIPFFRPV